MKIHKFTAGLILLFKGINRNDFKMELQNRARILHGNTSFVTIGYHLIFCLVEQKMVMSLRFIIVIIVFAVKSITEPTESDMLNQWEIHYMLLIEHQRVSNLGTVFTTIQLALQKIIHN
ncbi:hypothetical protein V2J09_017883 [Rumex salicifolius]